MNQDANIVGASPMSLHAFAAVSTVVRDMVVSYDEPHVYLRVGASGSGHTRFIHELAAACDLNLFQRHNGHAKNWFGRGRTIRWTKFHTPETIIAFDDMRPKQMCRASDIVYITQDSKRNKISTYVFSLDDRYMTTSGDIDADDALKYAFGNDGYNRHHNMLYKRITEIHHMLPNGTVRILASDGVKLADPIVLTQLECLKRQVSRVECKSGVGSNTTTVV
jgi:hypothetical protein